MLYIDAEHCADVSVRPRVGMDSELAKETVSDRRP